MDTTEKLGLNLPEKGYENWGVPLNENFEKLDTAVGNLEEVIDTKVAALETKVNEEIGVAVEGLQGEVSNLAEQTAKIEGLENRMTNCITEIPQDIKLELNDGTLTLKAGSKVYVPNGVGKFDEVMIESDISTNGELLNNITDKWFFFYESGGFSWEIISHCYSGSDLPVGSDNRVGFNTSTGKMMRSLAGAEYIDINASLPVCTFSTVNGKIVSTDQVFNGFSRIGSTAFALPGVKGLIPNGRNADGSLKNIELTVDKVITRTITWNNAAGQALFIGKYNLNEGIQFISTGHINTYFQQDTEPTKVKYAIWYKPSENKVYRCDLDSNSNLIWKDNFPCYIGQWFTSGTSPYPITELTTKLPFRAVDYNDFTRNIQELRDSFGIEVSYED